ncbi:hypothetical protein ABB37_06527 [Leptomonas pyrrhocoris]|uniref:Uncharacterized protein n=1 Tax=Leptomonas pyrrhocoris TaxID=157538 RepID=A0A0N0VEM9_LEPPY|nr:hypothetical protein ABB37_06527 [Leptomonas pyrrhocoris]KPA78424.1 hypothetical protein ABB37_06527 [Leptomonas pyrrhocoris]|eukprot:XP_015656863.1 hypothetical protein ABB37_06527 [Leptomonas pyrrhocoris]
MSDQERHEEIPLGGQPPEENDDIDVTPLLEDARTATAAKQVQMLHRQGVLSRAEYMQRVVALTDRLVSEPPRNQSPTRKPANVKLQMLEAQREFTDPKIRKFNAFLEKDQDVARDAKTSGALNRALERYIAALEAKLLSPVVASGAAILLGLVGPESATDTYEKRVLQWISLMVDEPEDTRLYRYNAFVVSGMPSAAMKEWREILDEVDLPLFPPIDKFSPKNLQIRLDAREASKALEAGGEAREKEPRQELYRRPRKGRDLLEGGGATAPVYGADGTQIAVVDLSGLEGYLETLSQSVQTLREEERAVGMALTQEIRENISRMRTPGRGASCQT